MSINDAIRDYKRLHLNLQHCTVNMHDMENFVRFYLSWFAVIKDTTNE